MRATHVTAVLATALVLTGCPREKPVPDAGFHGDVLPGGDVSVVCLVAATTAANAVRAHNGGDLAADRAFQAALTGCLGPDISPSLAVVAGRVAVDDMRLARQMVVDSSHPENYLALVRDRSRKLRRAQQDPAYAAAVAAGDEDNDFVPDNYPDGGDACPGTPDLTPTDERGCPDNTRPQAPDPALVRAAIDHMGLMVAPACNGAPLPSAPRPVQMGYMPATPTGVKGLYPPANPCVPESTKELCFDGVDNNCNGSVDEGCPAASEPRLDLAFTRSTNQPAGCLVLYEVELWLSDASNRYTPTSSHLVIRDFETSPLDLGIPDVVHASFQLDAPGQRGVLAQTLFQYDRVQWRMRAINADGLASQWSEYVAGVPLNTRQ